jgi:hypothetical protein
VEEFLKSVSEHVIGISSSLLVAALGAHLVWRNNFKTRRANACAVFRSTVLATLSGLYPHPANWPRDSMAIHNILSNRFPALQAAVAEFRPFVPWWQKRAFDKAWSIYRLGPDGRKIDTQIYHQYIGFDSMPNPKVTFHTNVSKLLLFSSET